MGIQLTINPEELGKKCKLMIATPMYGGQCAGLFQRAIQELTILLTRMKIPFQPEVLFNESLITRARNYACDTFMRSDCTHLLFLDSDIGFNCHDVVAMLALQSMDAEQFGDIDHNPFDIIGAPYPKKTISWEKIVAAVEQGRAQEDPEELSKFVGDFVFNPLHGKDFPLGQPVEVLEIGTGFMMIRRETMEKFKEAYPYYMYRPDHVRSEHFDGSRQIMQFFQAEIDEPSARDFLEPLMRDIAEGKVENPQDAIQGKLKEYDDAHSKSSRRYLSEDYWFCQKSIKAGMRIWLCPWMKTQHVGSYIFGGSVLDLASLGVSSTADLDQMNALKKKRGQKQVGPQNGPAPKPKNNIPAPKRGPKAKKRA